MLTLLACLISSISTALLLTVMENRRVKNCKHPFDYQLYPQHGMDRFKICLKCRSAWEWKNNFWQDI